MAAIPVNYTASLSRSFLKGDRLTVMVQASNFIGNHLNAYESRVVQGDYTSCARMTSQKKSFYINVSYRFGSLNAAVKKTASSISNDDLVGRKN